MMMYNWVLLNVLHFKVSYGKTISKLSWTIEKLHNLLFVGGGGGVSSIHYSQMVVDMKKIKITKSIKVDISLIDLQFVSKNGFSHFYLKDTHWNVLQWDQTHGLGDIHKKFNLQLTEREDGKIFRLDSMQFTQLLVHWWDKSWTFWKIWLCYIDIKLSQYFMKRISYQQWNMVVVVWGSGAALLLLDLDDFL